MNRFSGNSKIFNIVPPNERSAHLTHRLSIIAIPLIVLYFSYYHGIYRHYLSTPDADVLYAYEALLMNEAFRQDINVHTAYIYILFLALWVKIGGILGLITADTLSELPGPNAFEPMFAQIVFMGRWFSVFVAILFGWAFFKTIHVLTRNLILAILVSCIFAASPALIIHTQLLRPEILAMFFIWIGFMCLHRAMNSIGWRSLMYLFLSALFATLGIEAKVQVVPLAMAFPALALVFKFSERAEIRTHPVIQFSAAHWIFILAATTVSIVAGVMMVGQIRAIGSPGYYQAGIVLFVATSIWVYGQKAGLSWRSPVLASMAVSSGVAMGQLMHVITNDPENTKAVVNFVEHMSRLAIVEVSKSPGGLGEIFKTLPRLIFDTFRTFVTFEGGITIWTHNAIFWAALGGLVWNLHKGRKRKAARIAILTTVGVGMEVFCRLRGGFSPLYIVFVDPWLLAAIAMAPCRQYINQAATPSVVACGYNGVLVIVFIVGAFGSHHADLRTTQPIEKACDQARNYLKELPGYFNRYCN